MFDDIIKEKDPVVGFIKVKQKCLNCGEYKDVNTFRFADKNTRNEICYPCEKVLGILVRIA